MPRFSDYTVFADESGDHHLKAVDPQYPVFVLAFCLFSNRSYAERVVPAVDAFKERYFGCTDVILHEYDIRKSRGPFAILMNGEIREPFMTDLTRLITDAPFRLVASVIHKRELVKRYPVPISPYYLGMSFGLERLARSLMSHGCEGGQTPIVFERRGRKEDDALAKEFHRVCEGANMVGKRLPFQIEFQRKHENAAGLQLADLLARPIGRKQLDPAQPNRAYDVLERKFRRSAEGKITGWGLKVFP
ncbi:MAG: DUF3800 domain-containing protein [Longimicrobiaceae bacterium]